MRFVKRNNLEAGMSMARPIYSDDGRVLLNSGVILNDTYIKKIIAMGISGIYIITDSYEDVEVPEVIGETTRRIAISETKAVFESVRVGKTFNIGEICQSVNSIIDEIVASPHIIVNLSDIRTYDGYTFAHSVNVCVLSVILGLRFQLNQLELRELAIGAILHDIGKMKVPSKILNKPGSLTNAELAEVQKHSYYGWEVLRKHPEIPLLSAHIAYQHHERSNGKGYPRRLVDNQIDLYAKIVGVADAYDAMTSERVYRSGMLPAEALRLIKQLGGIQFNQDVVNSLLELVAPYPVGSRVILNTREIGVVVDVNQAERSRPIIRLLYQPDGRRIDRNYEVDLVKERNLAIVRGLQ